MCVRQLCRERLHSSCETETYWDFIQFCFWCSYVFLYVHTSYFQFVCLWCLELCTNNACFVEVVVSSREAVTSWASRVTLRRYTQTHTHMHAQSQKERELLSTFLAPKGPAGYSFSLCSTQATGLKSGLFSGRVWKCVCVHACLQDSGGALWRSWSGVLYGFVIARKRMSAMPFFFPRTMLTYAQNKMWFTCCGYLFEGMQSCSPLGLVLSSKKCEQFIEDSEVPLCKSLPVRYWRDTMFSLEVVQFENQTIVAQVWAGVLCY